MSFKAEDTATDIALLKWKVGAWGIQGLPLCPASPERQNTAPMAGKSPRPSHEPPFQAPVNADYTSGMENKKKYEGREGEGMLENNYSKLLRTTEAPTPKLH